MLKTSQFRQSRLTLSEQERVQAESDKVRIGLPGIAWAGLSLFVILLTLFLLLLMGERSVVHAAGKPRAWSPAMATADWATVQKLAKAEVDKNPRDAEAQNALGRALMEQGKLEEAEVPLITAKSLAPQIADYKVDLGELYGRRGVTQLAASEYREAISLDPSLVDIRWRLARALYALGEYEETLTELNQITRLEPNNWDAYRLTAEVAIGQKKYAEAIDNLKLYNAVVPDARALAKLAFAYMSLSPADTASARQAALRALQINPGDSQAHIALARISLIGRQNDQALDHYVEVADFFVPPRDAFFMGKIYNARKDLPKAEVALRTAASIDSTNKEYLSELGSNLILQQKNEDAAVVYERLIEVDPANMSAVANRAQALLQSGKADQALTLVQGAVQRDETNGALHKTLGDIYLKQGDRANAKGAYQRALETTPPAAVGGPAAEQLGYMMWEDGDFAGATTVLKKALQYDECNVRALLTLANCYMKTNQQPAAIEALKRGQDCPGSAQVTQMLRAIGG